MADNQTLEATPRRLARARQRFGRPTSPELTAAVALGVSALALPSLAAPLVAALRASWGGALAAARSPQLPTGSASLAQLGTAAQLVALAQLLAATLVAVAVTGAAVTWLQRGVFIRFAGAASADRELGSVPRASVIERIATSSFACSKWLVLMLALIAPWSDAVRGMLSTWQRAPHELLPIAGTLVLALLERAALVLALLGVIDFAVQQVMFRRRLRTSRQQLQEESRATEADPHATAERRRRAREQQTASVLQELSEVTAVVCDLGGRVLALREGDGAISLWIKGEGELGARLRAAAIAKDLPVVVDAPLAAALGGLEIGESLPSALAARVRARLPQTRPT